MEKLILFLVISLFAFSACSENGSILEPTQNSDETLSKYENLDVIYSIDKKKKGSSRNNQFSGSFSNHFIGGLEIVQLESFKGKYSKSYIVDGDKGGKIYLKIEWKDEDGKKVKLESKLTIPKYAFSGALTFDMIFDLENYALELYPSPFSFDLPVILDLKFGNINLSNIDVDNLNFSYLDGEEKMEYKEVKYDLETGDLEVKGALLHHFSRYGWTRLR